jgi:hypothetical protein
MKSRTLMSGCRLTAPTEVSHSAAITIVNTFSLCVYQSVTEIVNPALAPPDASTSRQHGRACRSRPGRAMAPKTWKHGLAEQDCLRAQASSRFAGVLEHRSRNDVTRRLRPCTPNDVVADGIGRGRFAGRSSGEQDGDPGSPAPSSRNSSSDATRATDRACRPSRSPSRLHARLARYASHSARKRSRPKLGSCPAWTTVTGRSRKRFMVAT